MIVELGGRAVHGAKLAIDEDRERDRTLAVEGWRVIRLTHHRLTTRSETIADDLRQMLARRNRRNDPPARAPQRPVVIRDGARVAY